jgi:tRNA A37 threonylcarbamoyladenosine dehydratase
MYDRQETLDLKVDQTLTIVGCGGIGAWLAIFAAMSGIRELILFDPDTLDNTNLNRLPFPLKWLGSNKAECTKTYIKSIRPDSYVKSYPFPFQELFYTKTDWLVDCTDKYPTQVEIEKIAKKTSSKYMKVGYDGLHISIHNKVAKWGKELDGYTIVPSWVGSPVIAAALAVTKIVKYPEKELSCNLQNLFIFR